MIGHCGGLRGSQTIGDYVLAHAYLRDDHVLDEALPTEIPIPPIAEVQVALNRAAEIVTGETGEVLKRRLRTGTVVTTDDRNWELRYSSSALRFNQSRAVAIDMAMRNRVREAAVMHREAMAVERRRAESGPAGPLNRPRTASFNVPVAHPAGAPVTHAPPPNPGAHPTIGSNPMKTPTHPLPAKKDEKKKS